MPRSKPRLILPQASAPFQSFTRTSPRTVRDTPLEASRLSVPSEVSSPLTSLSREEPHIPGVSQHAGYVAPSGFLTLSTPCSPHDLPGLFHPGSACGVLPFEALILARCRTPSRTPRPSWGFSPTPQDRGCPSRDTHTGQVPTTGLGISQVTATVASLGFPASRFAARNDEGRSHALHPLSRFFGTVSQ